MVPGTGQIERRADLRVTTRVVEMDVPAGIEIKCRSCGAYNIFSEPVKTR